MVAGNGKTFHYNGIEAWRVKIAKIENEMKLDDKIAAAKHRDEIMHEYYQRFLVVDWTLCEPELKPGLFFLAMNFAREQIWGLWGELLVQKDTGNHKFPGGFRVIYNGEETIYDSLADL